MEPTSEQLQELKKIELEMLKQFIAVCEKLKLKYYLLGGTLLGAVRHKGFIPWDDDIDVGMPRADYEIFVSKAQALLPDKYFVQTLESDPNLPMNFCKLRNSETTFIESSIKKLKLNHGVYIDVFPLDWYPSDENVRRKFHKKNRFLSLCVGKVFTIERESGKRKFLRKALKVCTFFMPVKKAVKKREKLLKSFGESDKLANYCGAWGAKEIVPKEWYGEGVALEFEGVKVNAPAEYDKWLTQVYGDYMQLPPEEKRVGHHYTEVIDLEKSYKEYVK